MLWKCCIQYASKFGKLSSGHRTGKGLHSNTRERQYQRMFILLAITLASYTSKVMLKILQARLEQYMDRELPDIQAGFRKVRGTIDQIANICWIIKKIRVSEKHLLLFYWLWQSLSLCGSQQTRKSFKRWEHQTTWSVYWGIYYKVRKKQLDLVWNNRLVANWERSMLSKLYIVTLI